MQEITKDDEIKEKLKYIGLDLENIPEIFIGTKKVDYRPIKAYDENEYRVYKYVPISKIRILLTPTNRLNTIKEKYTNASSLETYLKPIDKENIIKHTTFLKMLEKVQIVEIEEVEEEQKLLNKHIPFKVKYEENYLWQIYYSDIDNTYFMMVTTEDLEYASFFYLLKKQIEYSKTKKDEMIFVPIMYENYSNQYLKNSEILDIEKYLYFFTKNWSNVYEVYDKEQNLSIQIVGETFVYSNIKSIYRNKLKSKEEALKLYKFLKALFILSTQLPKNYSFIPIVNKKGTLEFEYENKKITYDNMFDIFEKDYANAKKGINSKNNEKEILEQEIKKLKDDLYKKEQEYFSKEKQIATYLECRKTFFGRVKYFLKSKKKKKENTKNIEENKEEKEKNSIIKNDEVDFESKGFYTVEDIMKVYNELDKINDEIDNLKMDKKALNSRIDSVTNKIKNAKLYIEEIDEHEKSIFEFWRFANKHESLMLNVGQVNDEVPNHKIEKVYNYDEDKEEIGILVDKKQRNMLTNKQMESIYIATTDCLNDLNNIDNNEILEIGLSNLKDELNAQRLLFEEDKIDIFGGRTDDNTSVKVLGNKKHRETLRDKLKILKLSKNSTINEYKESLSDIFNDIQSALKKVDKLLGIPVYFKIDNEDETGLKICSLDVNSEIANCNENEVSLYKINLKENTKVIYLSNCIYYDNYNQTLPTGMDVSDKCLINLDMYNLSLVNSYKFIVSNLINEFEITSKEIKIMEYNLEKK